MKKFLKPVAFMFAFLVGLSINGCILDAFDTLIQNVPISNDVQVIDTKTSTTSTATINLDSSSTYRSYASKIKTITFAQATFVVIDVTPGTLKADFTIRLTTSSGLPIFSKSFTNVTPVSYIGDANKFKLELTDTEKSYLNTLLNSSTKIFKGYVDVTNISGFTGQYQLRGHYDVALTLEVTP